MKRLVLPVASSLLVACAGAQQAAEEPVQTRSPLVLENIVLTETDRQGGQPLWELKARRAEYSRDRSTALVREVQGVFFKNGRKVLTVRAPRGEVRIASREIRLFEGVTMSSPIRRTDLSATEVQWFPDRDRLEGSGPIVIDQPQEKMRVRGDRLLGNLASQTYTLDGRVQADSEIQRARLNAPHVVWDLPANRIEAERGVIARSTEQGIVLTGASAAWDIGERRVMARSGGGAAVVAAQESTASRVSAETIAWNIPAQSLTGEGNARGSLNGGRTRYEAERAVYNLADQKLLASDARYWQADRNLTVESARIAADLRRNSVRADGRVVSRMRPQAQQ